jgi:hypothetical protein
MTTTIHITNFGPKPVRLLRENGNEMAQAFAIVPAGSVSSAVHVWEDRGAVLITEVKEDGEA